jgi:cysteine desulfurase/selenocysteine lyase
VPNTTAAPRADFPILAREIDGKPIIYLDNAATTFKPRAVLEAMDEYHNSFCGNVFRGDHMLAEEASNAFDGTRVALAELLGADPLELTFWLNTTDAINGVAYGLKLTKEDRVVVPISEHHSNFLPWLSRATIDVVPVDEQGFVDPDEIRRKLEQPARLVALGHVSNVTGAIQPVAEIAAICNEKGVPLLIDGAQGCPHLRVNLQELGCSFYAFSAHKMLGPTGVGALWARYDMMEQLAPFRVGGGMVLRVLKDQFEIKDPPHCFEAGTPNIAGIIGFGAAIRYLQSLDQEVVDTHEQALVRRMLERSSANPHLKLLGPRSPAGRVSLATMLVNAPRQTADHVSFKLSDRYAIMTRSGSHCAQPFYQFIGSPMGLRVSAYLYTSVEEVDRAFDAIDEILA